MASKTQKAPERREVENPFKREGKPMSLKKSAVRAAREDGFGDHQYEIKGAENVGYWYVIYPDIKAKATKDPDHGLADEVCGDMTPEEKAEILAETDPAPTDQAETVAGDANEMPKGGIPGLTKPQDPTQAPAPVPTTVPTEDEPKKTLKVVDMTDPAQKAEFEKENPPPAPVPTAGTTGSTAAPATPKPRRPHGTGATKIPSWAVDRHHSTIQNPVAVAWALADEMKAANPNLTRKQYIQEAEKRGLAYGTARSQYQSWFAARRDSEKNQAKVNGEKK